jgi:hypothetical protein
LKVALSLGSFSCTLQSVLDVRIAAGQAFKLFDAQIKSGEHGTVAGGYETVDFLADVDHWSSPLQFGCPQHKNQRTGGKAGKVTPDFGPGETPNTDSWSGPGVDLTATPVRVL